MTAELTDFTTESNWVKGKVGDDYWFEAKLYDSGSSFGIDDGRVSKLRIRYKGGDVVNYDRGWDIRPTKTHKPAYNAIMSLLENSPKRFQ